MWDFTNPGLNYAEYYHFPHIKVEAILASLSCQYTSNRNMEFVHTLCCYDNCDVIYLTAILHVYESDVLSFSRIQNVLKPVHISLVPSGVIIAIATKTFSQLIYILV